MAIDYGSKNTETIQSATLGTGWVVKNLDETDEALMGLISGGATAGLEREFTYLPIDDVPGNLMGNRRLTRYVAYLEFSTFNTSLESLKEFLPEAEFDEVNRKLSIGGSTTLKNTDYLKNIALMGPDTEGKNKIIKLLNALSVGNLTIARQSADATDGGAASLDYRYEAHYNPADLTVDTNGKVNWGDLLVIEEIDPIV